MCNLTNRLSRHMEQINIRCFQADNSKPSSPSTSVTPTPLDSIYGKKKKKLLMLQNRDKDASGVVILFLLESANFLTRSRGSYRLSLIALTSKHGFQSSSSFQGNKESKKDVYSFESEGDETGGHKGSSVLPSFKSKAFASAAHRKRTVVADEVAQAKFPSVSSCSAAQTYIFVRITCFIFTCEYGFRQRS